MAFVEKEYKPENYRQYQEIVGFNVSLPPNKWFIDYDRKIHFFYLGGQGDMPASTGRPPDRYLLDVNSFLYYFELRLSYIEGKFGETICKYFVESIKCLNGNYLEMEYIITLLLEALSECASKIGKFRIENANDMMVVLL